MKPPPRRGHESLRDVKIRNQKSFDLYADLYGKPRVTIDLGPEPKRRAPRSPDAHAAPSETDILKQIVGGLRMHPLVGMVERVNSGQSVETNADGSKRFVSFHHIYPNAGGRMRAVDLSVTLKNGKRLVVEVKRPPWSKPRNTREEEQASYIAYVRACNGYGLFATSWEPVAILLRAIETETKELK